MDLFLLLVTFASLTLALAMSVVAWRLYAQQQRASEARVDRLAEAIRLADPLAPEAAPPTAPWSFGTGAEDQATLAGGGRRVLPVAAAALVLPLLLAGVAGTGGTGTGGAGADSGREGRAASPRRAGTLELLALAHRPGAGGAEVTGTVRNPARGGDVARVSAHVALLDAAGAPVARASASLDRVRLAAGESAPFVVPVPPAPGAVRYRVHFEADHAGTLAHVDRRERW